MNAAAAEALYEAERKGVRQIKAADDGRGGRCAQGVICEALLGRARWYDTIGTAEFALDSLRAVSGIDWTNRADCPCCGGLSGSDLKIVQHLNDDHGLSFAEIARKLGPDA